MNERMRSTTLSTLDMGDTIDIFKKGQLPVNVNELVDQLFGPPGKRGSLVISGANGIVGAGKAMQLGSRLEQFNVPVIALDFPGVSNGINRQYPGLARVFGYSGASKIMSNIISLNYDGSTLPQALKKFNPGFLLEAIPEILDIKKNHYKLFMKEFPGIGIKSVTSGFPSEQLGVGIAHPAFPHEINKVFEIVEKKTSDFTRLLFALGLIPVPVGDQWSFVLDVLFCGLTLSGIRYHEYSNMPFWKIDKFIRKHFGPNPFRAHDVIGAKGANFLTWSCLFHLAENYGNLFKPGSLLENRKISGLNWYPPNHFRPVVDWNLPSEAENEFKVRIFGPLAQMTSLLLHEQRSHPAHINAIGELCAQFRKGILAKIREIGVSETIGIVEEFQKLMPEISAECWFPEEFEKIENPEWQQLYVNGEHNGSVGVITVSRESYNSDVDIELNRAFDWLKSENIKRVILCGDFHLSTQMVGADTNEFFPALEDREKGFMIARSWSETARRLYNDFEVSVGFINGKRCLGGFLELLMHCHFLVSTDDALIGMPEVTLPVVPGMEGCHWPFRRTDKRQWAKLLKLLLEGTFIKGKDARGWLTDFSGPLEDSLKIIWKLATGGDHKIIFRKVQTSGLELRSPETGMLAQTGDKNMEAGRAAIVKCIVESCRATLSKAIDIQAEHSADFMITDFCREGAIGADYNKTMLV